MTQDLVRKRADRRGPSEMRDIRVQMGTLARMDGSARFGFGSEHTLASFHGPQEVGQREELLDRAALKIAHRPVDGISSTSSKSLSSALEPIYHSLLSLHAFPRSSFQLTIQSLASTSASSSSTSTSRDISKSAAASAVNASTLAILDAGNVGMKGVTLAVAVAELPRHGRKRRPSWMLDGFEGTAGAMETEEEKQRVMVVDPSRDEESYATSKHVFAWTFGAGIAQGSRTKGKQTEKGEAAEDVDMEEGGQGGVNQLDEEDDAECAWCESEGEFDTITFQKAYNASLQACKMIRKTIQAELSKRETGRSGTMVT